MNHIDNMFNMIGQTNSERIQKGLRMRINPKSCYCDVNNKPKGQLLVLIFGKNAIRGAFEPGINRIGQGKTRVIEQKRI